MANRPAFVPVSPILIAALAATVESLTRLRERVKPPGKLIPIHYRNLHILYTIPPHRPQAPCVVLEAGANSWSPMWHQVATHLRPIARVFRYDRPGFGYSDPAPTPRPVNSIAEDLLSALIAVGAHPPYVLVAHSLGALYINALVCRLNPADVAGIVYVDAASLETVRMLEGEGIVSSSVPPRWLVRIVASLGLLRLLVPLLLRPYAKAFRGPLRKQALATWTRASWLLSYTGEWASALKESREKAGYKAGWLGSTPIAVIVPDIYERTKGKAYVGALQRAVADYSDDSVVVPVSDCGHFVQLERPDVVAATVCNVIERAREKALLTDEMGPIS